MSLGHFELLEGGLTFLAGPSEATGEAHGALNLGRGVTFLASDVS